MGLGLFRSRVLRISTGRFLSPDSSSDPDTVPYAEFENPQSLNLYSYAQNSPLTNSDPDGHDCIYADGLGGGTVKTGDCFSDQDNGIFIDGTINTQSFSYNAANNSSSFSYTTDDGGIGRGFLQGPDLTGSSNTPSPSSAWGPFTNGLENRLPRSVNGPTLMVGIMPWGMTGGLSNAVPGLMRLRLLSLVKDAKLRNIISDLYKATSSFGDGGTADAIAYERATGQAIGGTFHTMKGQQYATALQNVMNSGRLSAQETAIAQELLNQLQQALTYVGR
jgi:RHS repeat-associated protein